MARSAAEAASLNLPAQPCHVSDFDGLELVHCDGHLIEQGMKNFSMLMIHGWPRWHDFSSRMVVKLDHLVPRFAERITINFFKYLLIALHSIRPCLTLLLYVSAVALVILQIVCPPRVATAVRVELHFETPHMEAKHVIRR
jgi:hypothetical protein